MVNSASEETRRSDFSVRLLVQTTTKSVPFTPRRYESMMAFTEATHIVERMEELERRAGIRIQGIMLTVEDELHDGEYRAQVMAEIRSISNNTLAHDVTIDFISIIKAVSYVENPLATLQPKSSLVLRRLTQASTANHFLRGSQLFRSRCAANRAIAERAGQIGS